MGRFGRHYLVNIEVLIAKDPFTNGLLLCIIWCIWREINDCCFDGEEQDLVKLKFQLLNTLLQLDFSLQAKVFGFFTLYLFILRKG